MASVSNINILFVTLTNASVTLTNSSLTLNAQATGIPLLGTVNFTGAINGSSYTFTATLPSVSILGFTLSNVSATLDSTSFRIGAHAAGIPVVGAVDFSGAISASGFSLTATATNVDAAFIHFASIALTLNQTSLSLSAATNLPVVGNVTFTGAIAASGTFTISATVSSFTLLGFLTFNNATVSLSLPTPSLTVSAGIDLLNIGHVNFSGTISAGGHYSFTGSASLTVAGFSLGTASLTVSDAPANCITIPSFTTPPLPVVGRVMINGTYCSGGMFSFDVDIMPTPPLVIGGIPFNRFHFGLSNDSLTFGAGIGISFSGLNIGSAYLQGTIHTNGDFSFLAQVTAFQIAGFNAVSGMLTFSSVGGNYSLTLHAMAQFVVAQVVVDGSIDFNHGQFTLTGMATIGVAGFTLSNTTFKATNIGGLQIDVHSLTNIPNFLNVTFDGTLTQSGSSYIINVHATASVTVAGFNLASASLVLDNTHLAISVHFVGPVFTVDFSGTMNSSGAFDLSGSASLGLAGFVSVASASFHLTNTMLTIAAMMNLKVATVSLNGVFQSNGTYSLTGSASVGLGGYNLVTGMFTLNNSGASVAATLNLVVATVTFNGSIQTNGTYSLTGSASVGLGGYNLVTGMFTLNNSGASVSATLNVVVATVTFSGTISKTGAYSLTGSASVGLGGFTAVTGSFTLSNTGTNTLSVSATVNVVVAHVTFNGTISHTGAYSFQASAVANFAGFNWTTTFTISNASGVAISTRMSFGVMGFTASFSGTVSTNGTYSFTASTGINFSSIVSATLTLTLSNAGFSAHVHAGVDASVTISVFGQRIGIGFSGSFDASFAIQTNGNFSASGNFQMCAYLGVGGCVSIGFSISNHQFCVLTSQIGFTILGIPFYPFPDACFNY